MAVIDSLRALIRDLHAAGLDGDLLGRVAEMMAVGPVISTAEAVPEVARSPGAVRTARWRARRIASQASHGDVTVTAGDVPAPSVRTARGSLSVVENSANPDPSAEIADAPPRVLPLMATVTGVTSVTRRDSTRKKENPPHPLKKKLLTPSPKKGASPSASRRDGTGLLAGKVWIAHSTPLMREIIALRAPKSVPIDKQSGWWIDRFEVEAAERSLASGIASLPVTDAHGPLRSSHDPPRVLGTG